MLYPSKILRGYENQNVNMNLPTAYEENRKMGDRLSHVQSPDQVLYSLPKRSDFVWVVSWLQAVQNCLGERVVFALDESWMCQEMFLGRHLQYAIWMYGDKSLLQYDGVMLIGTEIRESDVLEKHGLYFTSINRTIIDAIDNEDVLDMQGTLEALSHYYFTHEESFDGISIPPEYLGRFNVLAKEAVEYYDY